MSLATGTAIGPYEILSQLGAGGMGDFLVNRERPGEARDVLAPVLAWFSEGHSTIDYVYAETLLKSIDGG